jgi:hypothetical protein
MGCRRNIIFKYFDNSANNRPSAKFYNSEYFIHYDEAAHITASPAISPNTLNDVAAKIYVNEYLANSFARY